MQVVSEKLSQHVLANYGKFVEGVEEVVRVEHDLQAAHTTTKLARERLALALREARVPSRRLPCLRRRLLAALRQRWRKTRAGMPGQPAASRRMYTGASATNGIAARMPARLHPHALFPNFPPACRCPPT